MSIPGHDRRLGRLEQKSGAKHDPWIEAVFKMAEEQQAAVALANFARALAGTDEAARLQRLASSPPDRPETPAAPAPLPGRSRPKGERPRPSPNDVLTWDQLVRVPWYDGAASAWVPQHPAEPARPRGPWENWGFVGPPSYDGEGDGRDESGTSGVSDEGT
ncbi:MAG: hypothetical protein ACHQK9_04140 [Reyranellales bacterium]